MCCHRTEKLNNTRDDAKKKDVDDFLEIYESDWKVRITSKALGTLYQAKFNKTIPLPDPNDTKKLAAYIAKEKDRCVKALELDVNAESYNNVLKISLACIIIFNKKRARDAHNLLLESYMNGLEIVLNNSDNITKHFNETGQALISKLQELKQEEKDEGKFLFY